MQENNNEDDYSHFFVYFCTCILQRIRFNEETKSENISTILTPSHEALMLVCMRVYYGNDMNLVIEGDDEIKLYVIKSVWQESGILMHSTFYHRVFANPAKNNDQFNKGFQLYIEEWENHIQSKNKSLI